MSIFKKMIENSRNKQIDRKVKIDSEAYIYDLLTSHYRNSYYKTCGNYDIYLQNPQRYDVVQGETVYLETGNMPTYIINFKSLEKAQRFMENNFYMGPEHQKDVKIDVVSCLAGSAIIIKPTSIDYEVHIEVDNEEIAQKLVKMFRRKYAENKHLLIRQLLKIKPDNKSISQVAEIEIDKLGIEF